VARAGPKKVHRYSLEFKRTAVNLSHLDGVQVQAVAGALGYRSPIDYEGYRA
jgi:transposase-like protein